MLRSSETAACSGSRTSEQARAGRGGRKGKDKPGDELCKEKDTAQRAQQFMWKARKKEPQHGAAPGDREVPAAAPRPRPGLLRATVSAAADQQLGLKKQRGQPSDQSQAGTTPLFPVCWDVCFPESACPSEVWFAPFRSLQQGAGVGAHGAGTRLCARLTGDVKTGKPRLQRGGTERRSRRIPGSAPQPLAASDGRDGQESPLTRLM